MRLDAGDAPGALEVAEAAVAVAVGGDREEMLGLCWLGVRAAADAALRARALRLDADAHAAEETGMALLERGRTVGGTASALGRARLAMLEAEATRMPAPPAPDPESWRAALDAWAPFGPRCPWAAYTAFRLAEALAAARAPAREIRAATLDAIARADAVGIPRLRDASAALARRRRIVADPSPEGGLPDASRARRADAEGARGPAPPRGRPVEPRDRGRAGDQREDGRTPRREHPRQARRAQPRRGRSARAPRRARGGGAGYCRA